MSKRHAIVVSCAVLFVAGTLLFYQPKTKGFPNGHHGWIASHTLANAVHTNLDNYLTGYTLTYKGSDGKPDIPVYFNRAPFVGTLLIGIPPRLTNDLGQQVWWSRILSNLVVVAAFAVMLLILLESGLPPLIAAGVCMLALSSHWLLYYRDMTSVDVYSVLAFAMVARAAQPEADGGSRKTRWWLVAGACSVGWGYASLVPLAMWAAVDGVTFARRNRTAPMEEKTAEKSRVWHDFPGFSAFLLGLLLSAGFLAHATIAEAAVRGVPIEEAGVVQSAKKRLGLSKSFNEKTATVRADAANILLDRATHIVQPGVKYIPRRGPKIWQTPRGLTLIFLPLALILLFVWTRPQTHRLSAGLLAFGGAGWFFAMPNLSLHHDYVAMSVVGTGVGAWAGAWVVLERVGSWIAPRIPAKMRASQVQSIMTLVLCLAAAAVFARSAKADYERRKWWAGGHFDKVTQAFEDIRAIVPADAPIYYAEGFRKLTGGAPYKVGFFLPTNPVASKPEDARFTVSRYVAKDTRLGQRRSSPSATLHLYERSDED